MAGLIFEHVDEDMADDAAFFLRVTHASKGIQETALCVHHVQIGVEIPLERVAHCLAFGLTQEPVIHKDTGNARADRPNEQCRRHLGIDAAGETADDAVIANALPQLRDRLFDERLDLPGAVTATDIVQEIAKNA